jgi:hypothetical protein
VVAVAVKVIDAVVREREMVLVVWTVHLPLGLVVIVFAQNAVIKLNT